MVPCSGKIWIMSYGAILDDPESWVLDPFDYLGNGFIDFKYIGNLDELKDYLSNGVNCMF